MRCLCCAGFFEDKDKDAKARGIAPPKKKDPNEEFKSFMESIDADVQDAEDVAAEEAAEEALERDQLDDFEQRYLVCSAPARLVSEAHMTILIACCEADNSKRKNGRC